MERSIHIKSVRDIPFGIPFHIRILATSAEANYTSCLFIVQPCDIIDQPPVTAISVFVSDDEVDFVVTDLASIDKIAPITELNCETEHIKSLQTLEETRAVEDRVVKTGVKTTKEITADKICTNSVKVSCHRRMSTRNRESTPKRKYSEMSEKMDCVLNEIETQARRRAFEKMSHIKTKRYRGINSSPKSANVHVKITEGTNKNIEDEDSQLLYSHCVKSSASESSDNTNEIDSYTCKICESNIDCKEAMVTHIKMHISLKCSHCGFIAINEKIFQHHVDELYCKSLGYVCKECGDAMSSFMKLKSHLGSVHNKPVFTCRFCSDGFSNGALLKKHIADFHATNMLPCEQCGSMFQFEEHLILHKKNCKGKVVASDMSMLVSVPVNSDTHGMIVTEKIVCKVKLPRKEVRLEDHPDTYSIETVTSLSQKDRGKSDNDKKTVLYACKICNSFRIGDKKAMEGHLAMHENGDLSCKSCNFEASNIPELRKHSKQHLQSESGCVCDVCGIVMMNQDKLRQHLGSVHNMAVFECEYCSTAENVVRFRSRPQLREHCMQDHPDKAIQCTRCAEPYFSQLSFRAHKFQCRGQPKPSQFQCPQCERIFKMSNSLKRHIRYAHKMERNYKCDLCTFVTFKRETLNNHIKTHLKIHDFKCEQCTFTCVKRDQLKSHMKTHTQERPFRCDQCPYASAANVQLKAHRSVHSAATAVHCPLCGVVVRDNRAYSRHCSREHKTSPPVATTSQIIVVSPLGM